MPKSPEIQLTNVSLILGPRGIKLDERGRIRFVQPEILQALVTGSSPEARLAADGNYVQCSCNNYQCSPKQFAQSSTDVAVSPSEG